MPEKSIVGAGAFWAAVGRRQRRRSGQVVTGQKRNKVRILLQGSGAVARVGQRGVRGGAAVGLQARGVCRWIPQPAGIPLRNKSVFILNADLYVVNSTHIRHAGAGPGIGEPSALTLGRGLKIGRKVGKRVGARIIVILILPHESAERENCLGIQEMSPDRSNVKRSDLGALILGADQ